MRSPWIKAALFLAAIWLIAGGAIWLARRAKATPASVERYLATHSVEGRSSSEREKIMNRLADQLNQLTYEQRREMRVGRKLDAVFRALTPEEQARFLDLTLPAGFRQMMEAFNKMEPKKRKDFVYRALREMQGNEGEDPPPRVDDKNVEKIVNQGLKSFYTDSSAEVKMDFAPLIEQMQRNLQGFR